MTAKIKSLRNLDQADGLIRTRTPFRSRLKLYDRYGNFGPFLSLSGTLTLTEWERLQGFPDGWTEGIPDSARFGALGNSMHVGMATWLARQIHHVHQSLPLIGATA